MSDPHPSRLPDHHLLAFLDSLRTDVTTLLRHSDPAAPDVSRGLDVLKTLADAAWGVVETARLGAERDKIPAERMGHADADAERRVAEMDKMRAETEVLREKDRIQVETENLKSGR